MKTLIIGYGNPLRGDDALGPLVARQLASRLQDERGVDVSVVHQLTPDLAGVISHYQRVVLIDARDAAGSGNVPPGQLYLERVCADEALPQSLTHHVTPGQLLAVTRVLFGIEVTILLAGITTDHFELGEPMSSAVKAALPSLTQLVCDLIACTDTEPKHNVLDLACDFFHRQ